MKHRSNGTLCNPLSISDKMLCKKTERQNCPFSVCGSKETWVFFAIGPLYDQRHVTNGLIFRCAEQLQIPLRSVGTAGDLHLRKPGLLPIYSSVAPSVKSKEEGLGVFIITVYHYKPNSAPREIKIPRRTCC